MWNISRDNSSLVMLPGPRGDMVRGDMEALLVVGIPGGTVKVQFLDILGGIVMTLDREGMGGAIDFAENGFGRWR